MKKENKAEQITNMRQNVQFTKSTKMTLVLCLLFISVIFSYTVLYKIKTVTGLQSNKYHQAIDTYMNSETYN